MPWGISYYEGFYDLFDINSSQKVIDYTIETGNNKIGILLTATELEEELTEEEYNKIQGLTFVKDDKEETLSENYLV